MYIECIGMDVLINDNFKKALVPLSEVERDQLCENIVASEGIDPAISKILLWQPDPAQKVAYIIEGHNRFEICRDKGFDFSSDCFEFSEPFENEEAVIRWIEDNQLGRRNLSKYARFEIIYRRERKRLEAEGKKRMAEGGKVVQGSHKGEKKHKSAKDFLADKVGVSPRSIQYCIKIYKHYCDLLERNAVTKEIEEIMVKLRTGDITINEAMNTLFPKKQKEQTEEEQPEEVQTEEGVDAEEQVTEELIEDKDQRITDLEAELKSVKTLKAETENRMMQYAKDLAAERSNCKSAQDALKDFRKKVSSQLCQYGLRIDDDGNVIKVNDGAAEIAAEPEPLTEDEVTVVESAVAEIQGAEPIEEAIEVTVSEDDIVIDREETRAEIRKLYHKCDPSIKEVIKAKFTGMDFEDIPNKLLIQCRDYLKTCAGVCEDGAA